MVSVGRCTRVLSARPSSCLITFAYAASFSTNNTNGVEVGLSCHVKDNIPHISIHYSAEKEDLCVCERVSSRGKVLPQ